MKQISKTLDDLIVLLQNGCNKKSIINQIQQLDIEHTYSASLQVKLNIIKRMLYTKVSDNILLDFISNERLVHKKDTWLVFGQLDSVTNDNTDSITFFKFLQDNKIPSKYIVNKKSISLPKLKNYMQDVILCNGNCISDFEFIERTKKYLIRTKVVICENAALNKTIKTWLKNEYQLEFVFMQHGVTFHGDILKRFLDTTFNILNVCSEHERDLILNNVSNKNNYLDKIVIAGLPRFDLYQERRITKNIFIMFTWRQIFSKDISIFKRSKYLQNLIQFTKEISCIQDNLDVKFNIGLHHHMTNTIDNIYDILPNNINIVNNSEISQYIQNSCMLITDFSSVSFDFLFQQKPVIFWQIDKDDKLIPTNTHDDGVKMKNAELFLKQNMFNVVYSIKDVIKLIEYYNTRKFKLEEKYIQDTRKYFNNTSNICHQLFKKINEKHLIISSK